MSGEKQAFDDIMSVMLIRRPFYAFLIKKFPVVYRHSENQIAMTSFNSEGHAYGITLFDNFFKLKPDMQQFVLMHEMGHVIGDHAFRAMAFERAYGVTLNPALINIVGDAKINEPLREDINVDMNDYVTYDTLKKMFPELPNNLDSMSFEEILLEIKNKHPPVPSNKTCAAKFGKPSISANGDANGAGEVLNEGDDDVNGKTHPDDWQKVIDQKVKEVLAQSESIGIVPGGFKRLVSDIPKHIIDWRRILKDALTNMLSKDVKKSWARENRKNSDAPTKIQLGKRRVILLADTSGSVSDQMLGMYLSEALAIVRLSAELIVIPWDTEAYPPIKVTSKSIAKVKNNLYGGCGTLIHKALEQALEIRKRDDVVVIVSDFYIGDIQDPSVVNLMKILKPLKISYGEKIDDGINITW